MKPPLRLLPLAGLVAFPGHDFTLSVDARVGIELGQTVGLVFRQLDGKLASVGTLATAHNLACDDDDDDACCVLSCRATSRFRLVEHDGSCATAIETHVDTPADVTELSELLRDVQRRAYELSELASRADGGADSADESPLDDGGEGSSSGSDGSSDPEALSLALAGRIEHETLEDAQQLLAGTSTAERLEALDTALAEAISFTSTQLMLQRLGMSSS